MYRALLLLLKFDCIAACDIYTHAEETFKAMSDREALFEMQQNTRIQHHNVILQQRKYQNWDQLTRNPTQHSVWRVREVLR